MSSLNATRHIFLVGNDRGSVYQLHVGTVNEVVGVYWSKYSDETHQEIFDRMKNGDYESCHYVGEVPLTTDKYLVILDPDSCPSEPISQVNTTNDPCQWIFDQQGVKDWNDDAKIPENEMVGYSREEIKMDCDILYQFSICDSMGDPHGSRIIDTSKPYPTQIRDFGDSPASEDYFQGVYIYTL